MNYRFFSTLILVSVVGFAQEKQKDSTRQLQEVIIDAQLTAASDLGVIAFTQLQKADLQTLSTIDIAGILNQIPGVHLLSGALNTNRITLRGIGARTPYGTDKLRLYLNNIPLTNGSGSSSLETIDIEDLQGVTVVKGPKATAFGANLGGAILLQRDRSNGLGTSFNNSFTLGSYQFVKNNFKLNHQTEKSSLGVSYGVMRRDGYRENSEFDRQTLRLNYMQKLSEKDELSLLVDQVNYTAHIPSSLSLRNFEDDPRQAAFTWAAAKGYEKNRASLIGLNYNHHFNTQQQINTSIFYAYLDHYEPRPFNILEEFTHGYRIRSVFTGEVNKRIEYLIGTEVYQDRYTWSTFENLYQDNGNNGSKEGDLLSANKERRNQYFLFTSLTYAFRPSLQLMVGLNFNKTTYHLQNTFNEVPVNTRTNRNFDGIVLPSISMQYKATKDLAFHANVSRGFSNPGLEETLNPDGLVNPEIAQEKGVNYELGTVSKWLDRRLSLQVDVYQMNVKNLLVAQRIGDDQYVGKNAGKTRHRGLEIALQYVGDLGSKWQFKPQLSYELTNHRFIDFIDFDEDYSGNPLTGVPENRLFLAMNISHDNGWYLHVNQQYIDEIPLNDANTLSSEAFSVFKTKMGYRTELFENCTSHFYLGINNVFDTNYASSVLINAVGFGSAAPRYYYPGDGRNIYGGVQLNYQL